MHVKARLEKPGPEPQSPHRKHDPDVDVFHGISAVNLAQIKKAVEVSPIH
jgi:hypothetical protein